MNGYLINFGLSAAINQQDLIQALKTNGADVIQTGSGLCVKSEKSAAEMKASLIESKFKDVNLVLIQGTDESLSPDIKSFLKS